MEYALFIAKVANLRYFEASFSRLYFGNEFCERLLPTQHDVSRVLDFASSIDFTLVTPYVTEQGLAKLRALFDLVTAKRPGAEVVFNDWGVFSTLREQYRELQPVMGRLLNKTKRDPRIAKIEDSIPEDTMSYLRGANLSVGVFRRYLLENGVKRAEFDNVLHGLDFPFDGMALSVYMPFAYLTTTRACLVNSCDVPEKSELVGIFPCRKECQQYAFHLSSDAMPVTLVRMGNTMFFKNEDLPKGLAHVSRVVIEPEIPM